MRDGDDDQRDGHQGNALAERFPLSLILVVSH